MVPGSISLEVTFFVNLFCSSLCKPLLPILLTLYNYGKTRLLTRRYISFQKTELHFVSFWVSESECLPFRQQCSPHCLVSNTCRCRSSCRQQGFLQWSSLLAVSIMYCKLQSKCFMISAKIKRKLLGKIVLFY